MAEPHVVTALVAKRAELSGDLERLDERRTAIKAHIANLDAVLRLFCYAGDPARITPRRKRNWLFRRGDLQRMVHDIEREAARPRHRDDIALEVLNRKGWAHDPDLLDTVADKVKDVRKRSASIRRVRSHLRFEASVDRFPRPPSRARAKIYPLMDSWY